MLFRFLSFIESLPLGAVTRTKDQIDFFITSPITKSTSCYLFLPDGSLVNTLIIHPESWADKHSFRYLKPSSSYRIFCGLSTQQAEDVKFEELGSLITVPPAQSSFSFPWIGILVVIVGVVCVVLLYLRRTSKEEEEDPVEDEVSLLHEKPYHGLSREATAALRSLESQTWRCEICTFAWARSP